MHIAELRFSDLYANMPFTGESEIQEAMESSFGLFPSLLYEFSSTNSQWE